VVISRSTGTERNWKRLQKKIPALFRHRGCQTCAVELSRGKNMEKVTSEGITAEYEQRGSLQENIKVYL
jgi:hypothetical protein